MISPIKIKPLICDELPKRSVNFPVAAADTSKWALYGNGQPNIEKAGFSGLKPQPRKDRGTSRKLTEGQKDEIIRLKTENPRRPATTIRRKMISTGFFPTGIPSESTIQRYLAKVVPDLRRDHIEDMRAFEMAHVNELWQMDTTHGPFITNDGHKRKVYIVGIIDDASRYLVGWHLSYKR